MTVRYAVRPVSALPAGRITLLVDSRTGSVTEVGALAGMLAVSCRGVGSLEDHATGAARAGVVADRARVLEALDRLAAAGILYEVRDVAPTGPRAEERLDCLILTSRNDPRILERLEALERHCSEHHSRTPWLVIEGGPRPVCSRDSLRRIASSVGRPIHLIDEAVAGLVSRALAVRVGVGEQTVRESVSLDTMGGRRNMALLLTAGRRVLFLAEDAILRTWGTPTDGCMRLGGHDDPRDETVFSDEMAALATMKAASVDLEAQHAAFLGHNLVDLVGQSGCTVGPGTCAHVADAVYRGEPGNIRLTASGAVGARDSACRYKRLLFAGLPGIAEREADDASFEAALTGQGSRRGVSQATVAHLAPSFASCLGVSTTAIVPPYMRHDLDQDFWWGEFVRYAFQDPLTVFLPSYVERLPREPQAPGFPSPSIPVTVSEFMVWLVSILARPNDPADPFARIARLGTSLLEVGSLPDANVRAMLLRATLDIRTKHLALFEQSSGPAEAIGASRLAAYDEYRRQFRVRVSKGDLGYPSELQSIGEHCRVPHFKEVIYRYGTDIGRWSALWDASRQLGWEAVTTAVVPQTGRSS